jgi:hypothetical protein
MTYFRWRQVPYAQEQTLSGLFIPDGAADEGFLELGPNLGRNIVEYEGHICLVLLFFTGTESIP